MPAHFSIDVDASLHLVRMKMEGFFAPQDIARFVEARDLAHQQLRSLPNEHVTLVDITGMDIQSQDAVTEFQRVLSSPATASRRIAFVVALSLARGQIRRAARGRTAEFFATTEEAERWLLEPASAR